MWTMLSSMESLKRKCLWLQGFEAGKHPDWDCKLRKALYGLKQASRA